MRVGFALRSTVFSPALVSKIIPLLDQSAVDSIWFPSVGRAFDALDMCGVALGESHRLKVGTGVIRSTDYDATHLLARVHTLSEGSGRRFVLGVGTGSGTGRIAVDALVKLAAGLRDSYPELAKPPVFFAALKRQILRTAYLNVEGAILNFCPPSYVNKIVPRDMRREGFTLACYIKLFFAEEEATAKRMLVDEVKTYYHILQYRLMFEEAGAAKAIEKLDEASDLLPEVLEISSANPSDDEVVRILSDFRSAGVDLPILYPYVSGNDSYRMAVVKRLADCLSGE